MGSLYEDKDWDCFCGCGDQGQDNYIVLVKIDKNAHFNNLSLLSLLTVTKLGAYMLVSCI